ncbi:MAG: peptidoglycan-binding protein [Patescibacteria group bacterium]|nr:peptidoglycan-binding protein [Patescibacteria group bacterium]
MKAIKKFQKDHGLTEDGYPGKETIKELLKVLNGEEIINDNLLTNPVEEVVNDPIQEQPQIQEQVPENLVRDETKAKKAIEELNNNNKRLHQKKEYLQNLQ